VNVDFEANVSLRSLVRVPRVEPGAPLVIALHGRGMTARAFARWLRPGIEHRDLSWWLPRGILPTEISSRRIGYASRSHLAGLVAIARRRLQPSSIALLGFSQGAYLASYVALSRPDLVSKLVCCCGRPKSEFIEGLAAARRLRVLVQTGTRDTNVPPDLIEKGVTPLHEAGLSIEERSYDAEHEILPAMAVDAAEFVA
jgi:predicted esterase